MPLADFGERFLIVSVSPDQRDGTWSSSEKEGFLYSWSTAYEQVEIEHYT